jgi:hypothetical protein
VRRRLERREPKLIGATTALQRSAHSRSLSNLPAPTPPTALQWKAPS